MHTESEDINAGTEVDKNLPQPVAKKGLRVASKDGPVNHITDRKKSQYMLDMYNSTELLSFDEE